ncbi:Nca2p [Rhodotorula paludigena]|uniref:Nca2p n=1 Tax=Rhodotorula paludigena TaxID=86838 RepID=UPI00316FD7EE
MASYAADLTAHLAATLSSLSPSLVSFSPGTPSSDLQASTSARRHSPEDIQSREDQLKAVLAKLRPSGASSSSSGPSARPPAASLSAADLAALVDGAFPPFQGQAAIPLSRQTETVELVTLAQLAVAAYGVVLRTLMDEAAELELSDQYWSGLESEAWSTALYLVQTTPSRAVSLATVTATRLRQLTAASLRTSGSSPGERPSLFQLNTWRRALPPSLFLTSVFPHLAGTSGLPSLAELDKADSDGEVPIADPGATSALSLSSATRLTRQTARSLVFLTLSPLSLTRQEIAQRREGIRRARDELAQRIGELTLVASESDAGDKLLQNDDAAASEAAKEELQRRPGLAQLFTTQTPRTAVPSQKETADLSLDDVKQGTWQTLIHLDGVLTPASSSPTLSATSLPPSTPADLAHSLSFLLSRTLPSHQHRFVASSRALAPPSALARAWPTLITLPLASLVLARAVYHNRATLRQWLAEGYEAARGFALDWVVEPVRKILDTLRGGDEGVALMGRESLRSDLESLERMVVDFARDQYRVEGGELAQLRERARQGDLTTVLKAWEQDIKSPIRSAVSGSLIRTLLIQVQKVKVDVALAMDGIEKMLKSQQLTFAFVGVAPSMLVLAVLGRWMRGLVRRDGGSKKRRDVNRRCWMTLRQLDLLLSPPRSKRPRSSSTTTSSSSSPSSARALTQGYLLLSLSSLRTYSASAHFPSRDTQLRAAFLDDVRALEDGAALAGGEERRVLVGRLERWARGLGWDEGVRA